MGRPTELGQVHEQVKLAWAGPSGISTEHQGQALAQAPHCSALSIASCAVPTTARLGCRPCTAPPAGLLSCRCLPLQTVSQQLHTLPLLPLVLPFVPPPVFCHVPAAALSRCGPGTHRASPALRTAAAAGSPRRLHRTGPPAHDQQVWVQERLRRAAHKQQHLHQAAVSTPGLYQKEHRRACVPRCAPSPRLPGLFYPGLLPSTRPLPSSHDAPPSCFPTPPAHSCSGCVHKALSHNWHP